VWLLLVQTTQGLVANPSFLALRAGDATHPVWLGRLSGEDTMIINHQ